MALQTGLVTKAGATIRMPPIGGLPLGGAPDNPLLRVGSGTIAMWLDAALASTITTSGGNVTLWADRSGRGVTGTRVSGTIVTGSVTQNGLNGITFSASGYMTAGIAMGVYPYTLAVVGKSTNLGSANSIIASASSNGLQFRQDTTGAFTINKENTALIGTSTGTVAVNNTYLAIMQVSSTGFSYSINGGLASTGTHSQTLSASNANIGRNGGGNNEFLIGTIFEMAMWPNFLRAGDVGLVQQSLNAKWKVY